MKSFDFPAFVSILARDADEAKKIAADLFPAVVGDGGEAGISLDDGEPTENEDW